LPAITKPCRSSGASVSQAPSASPSPSRTQPSRSRRRGKSSQGTNLSLLSHLVAFFAAPHLLPLSPPILIPSPSSRESRRAASFIDPADRFPQPPHPSPYSTAVGIPQHQTELDCLPSPASRLPTLARRGTRSVRVRPNEATASLQALFLLSRDCRGDSDIIFCSRVSRVVCAQDLRLAHRYRPRSAHRTTT
jgi:hypothetical protein